MSDPSQPIVQMGNISKTFPGGVRANDDVSLAVWPGTIHALIGENGAGKSTLMNVLYGRFQPDHGRIRLRGQEVRIESPSRAISLGVGMVTQHTTMIPAFSALDNVILGAEPARGGLVDRAAALRKVDALAAGLNVQVDWRTRAESLSVAALQKAEIVKALYRGASVLILDEPTATLAPQEADALFSVLHRLVDSGATVLFVTHKLREVMAHSDRVTVLRGGKTVGERITSHTYPEDLLALMLGHRTAAPGMRLGEERSSEGMPLTPWERGPGSEMVGPAADAGHAPTPSLPMLEVLGVSIASDRGSLAVRDVSLTLAPGEVLGVAGVDGSGQRELAEAIVGLRPVVSGRIVLDGKEVTATSVAMRLRRGIAYVPEDRQREGLILDFSVAENMLLGRQRDRRFGGGTVLGPGLVAGCGEAAIREHRIRAAGGDVPARTLSGGNQQKLVIARALDGNPRLLVAMQPTRGLDVEATRYVYESIRAAQVRGLAVLLFSLDLEEIFEIAGRIAVIYNGGVAGILSRKGANPETVGRLMVAGIP